MDQNRLVPRYWLWQFPKDMDSLFHFYSTIHFRLNNYEKILLVMEMNLHRWNKLSIYICGLYLKIKFLKLITYLGLIISSIFVSLPKYSFNNSSNLLTEYGEEPKNTSSLSLK